MDALCQANVTTAETFAKEPYTEAISDDDCFTLSQFTAKVHKVADGTNWMLQMFLSPYYREISGLENFQAVTFLSVIRCRVKQLDGLACASNLRFLFLDDNDITDLSPLSKLQKLEFVSVSFNPVSEINFCSSTLTTLNLNSTRVASTSFLINFQSLKFLSLRFCRFVELVGCSESVNFVDLSQTCVNYVPRVLQTFPNLASVQIRPRVVQKVEDLVESYGFVNYINNRNFPKIRYIDGLDIGKSQVRTQLLRLKIENESFCCFSYIESFFDSQRLFAMKELQALVHYQLQLQNIKYCIINDLADFDLSLLFRQKLGQYVNTTEIQVSEQLKCSFTFVDSKIQQITQYISDFECLLHQEYLIATLPINASQNCFQLNVNALCVKEFKFPQEVDMEEQQILTQVIKQFNDGRNNYLYTIQNDRLYSICVQELLQKIEMYGDNNDKVQHSFEIFRYQLRSCTTYYYLTEQYLQQIEIILSSGMILLNQQIPSYFINANALANVNVDLQQSVLLVKVLQDKDIMFVIPCYYLVLADNLLNRKTFNQLINKTLDQFQNDCQILMQTYNQYAAKSMSSDHSESLFDDVLVNRLSLQNDNQIVDLHNAEITIFDSKEQDIINSKQSIIKLNLSFNSITGISKINLQNIRQLNLSNCQLHLDKLKLFIPNCIDLDLSFNKLDSPLSFLTNIDAKVRQQIGVLKLHGVLINIFDYLMFFRNYFKNLSTLNDINVVMLHPLICQNDLLHTFKLFSSSDTDTYNQKICLTSLQESSMQMVDVSQNGSIIVPSALTKMVVDQNSLIKSFSNTNCRFFQTKSLSPIASQLTQLNLSGSDVIEIQQFFDDMASVKNSFDNLLVLNLSQCQGIVSIEFLQHFRNLQQLRLNNITTNSHQIVLFMKQLSSLLTLQNLIVLEFQQCIEVIPSIDVKFAQFIRSFCLSIQYVTTVFGSIPYSLMILPNIVQVNGKLITHEDVLKAKQLLQTRVTIFLIQECAQVSQDGKYLNVSDLQLKSLEYRTTDTALIDILSKVEFIDASNNLLSSLSWLQQSQYPMLKQLNLQNNQICEPFVGNIFSESLQCVDLTNNPITKLMKSSCHLPNVSRIILNDCVSLRAPNSQMLSHLSGLRTIEMSGISFMNYSKETFLNLSNLECIVMNNNQLRDLDIFFSLIQYKHLRNLDIKNNRISTLQTILTFINQIQSLVEISVEGNGFSRSKPKPTTKRTSSEPAREISGGVWYLDSFIEWGDNLQIIDGIEVTNTDRERVREQLQQQEMERQAKLGIVSFGNTGPPKQLSGIRKK